MMENNLEKLNYEAFNEVLKSVKSVLIEKNKRYGNSALRPLGVFYKGDNANSIRIRIDDKLSRIKNSSELRKNDVYDLLGYCILYLINERQFIATPFEQAVNNIISDVTGHYVNSLFRLTWYDDVTEFSYSGFSKSENDNKDNVIRSLNGTCSDIKNQSYVNLHKVEMLILFLVIYFINKNITDFSDLID